MYERNLDKDGNRSEKEMIVVQIIAHVVTTYIAATAASDDFYLIGAGFPPSDPMIPAKALNRHPF